MEAIRYFTYCRNRMSLDEDQRTVRDPVSETSMLKNPRSMSKGGYPSHYSGESRQWSRTQHECGTTSTKQQGKKQICRAGQGEKQTPNNRIEGF